MTVFRRGVLWFTIIVLGVAIVLLVRYRPGLLWGPQQTRLPPVIRTATPVSVEPTTAGSDDSDSQLQAEVRQEVERIKVGTAQAARLLLRARSVLGTEEITVDNAAAVLYLTNSAFGLLDSSSAELAQARHANQGLLGLSHRLAADAAYALSSFCTKAERYLEALEEETEDQIALFGSLVAACRAATDGNQAEASIKQNVAVSLRRRSEARERALARRKAEFEEAARKYLD